MRLNLIKRMLLLSAVAAMALLVAAAPAFAGMTVIPDQYDFGDVEVGSTASTQIQISNEWWGSLSINGVQVQGDSDFTLVNPPSPGTDVPPGSAFYMGVEFSPTAEGLATATVVVQWSNGEAGVSYVEVSGTGVPATPPPTSIADVLACFDESAANGTLYGSGPGGSADGRLGALRDMIVAAGDYIDQGEYALAVAQLEDVLARCDGDSRPPDFAEGVAAATLYYMVEDVIAALVA